MRKVTENEFNTAILQTIERIKNCIKTHTQDITKLSPCDNTLVFQTKENVEVKIKLYK